MNDIVADASVIVDALLGDELVLDVLERSELHVPKTVHVEAAGVIARLHRSRDLDQAGAEVALDDLLAIQARAYDPVEMVRDAFAWRQNVSLQDGIYVALARALHLPLYTRDLRLRRAVRQRNLCSLVAEVGG